ncbi:hypothetical protein AB0L65_20905 [Nonomuraea sp. NPDC052116]|uniref:hypothetical protein n=1 Tax=Nonomuraea sp. NPDC052116 TaxID=3155665 RepID=UPI003446A126
MTGRRIAQILTAAGGISYALLVIDMARQSPSPAFIALVTTFGLVSTIATALFGRFRVERDLAYSRGLHSVTETLRN